MNIRVAVFDHNENIRNTIELLFRESPRLEIAGNFGDLLYCVERVVACKPDMVLMDIEMPPAKGIEAVRMIKRELPHVPVLVQTAIEDEVQIFESLRAGASGYILKSTLNHALIKAIFEIRAGGAPMTPWVARKVLQVIRTAGYPFQRPAVDYKLTAKEKEVLTFIVNGASYKMIMADLSISYDTVRSHVKKIYGKLQVASLTEVVSKVYKEQII